MLRYIVLVFIMLVFVGCTGDESISNHVVMAQDFLRHEGYEVVSYEGEGRRTFAKSDLLELSNEQVWAVQYTEPDEYLNKQIETVSFTVKNHPLDEQFNMGKTSVTVWLQNGEVIGGWSFPVSKKNDVAGAPSSLDGKTAEEVQGDYSKWQEQWREKYGE
ncbi:hypothetical protein M3202_07705 [Alkalihalobacillus oceani]|uniref:DUF4830 domain-containing protein n=1 Tax=Halalkalibacter oceani TaxID=1653776 RepID=A0A9X2DRR4_9BACI|nr:hypothetical protein [Halalkalibacter oceani]MCM3713968.1 hypothetical protein [Halalkalibacter oceani]